MASVQPPATLRKTTPAQALGVVLAKPLQRLHDLVLAHLAGLGQIGGRDRVRGEEQQRLDYPGQLVHTALTLIGPKGSDWDQAASPAL